MSVRDDLVNLKNEMESYRDELYAKYMLLYSLIEDKNREMIVRFRELVQDPILEVKDFLGKKIVAPTCSTAEVVEPKFTWAGNVMRYGLPRTVRNYDLISVPMFEFDPITDKALLEEVLKNANTMPLRSYIIARFEHETFPDPTQEDVSYQYVVCDSVVDYGTYDEEVPFENFGFFVMTDGSMFTTVKLYEGTKVTGFYWSKNIHVNFITLSGKIMFKNVDTEETFDEEGILIQLSAIDYIFGAGARWLYATTEIPGMGLYIRKTGIGIDVIPLYHETDARMAREAIKTLGLLTNLSFSSFLPIGVGRIAELAINKFAKVV